MRKALLWLLLLKCILALDLEEYMYDEERDPEVLFRSYTPNLEKQTVLQTLIFYTPWNKQGREYVLKYASKFDYVSPCWYEVNLKDGRIVLDHESNYDSEFIQQAKTTNPKMKVLPRVYIPGTQTHVVQALANSDDNF